MISSVEQGITNQLDTYLNKELAQYGTTLLEDKLGLDIALLSQPVVKDGEIVLSINGTFFAQQDDCSRLYGAATP